MKNYLLKSSEALPKSQGGVFAALNTTRATFHPTLHTLPRATRYAATLLLLLCLEVGNAWGTGTAISNLNFNAPASLPSTSYYTYSSKNSPSIATFQSISSVNICDGGGSTAPDTWSATNAKAPSGGKRYMAFQPAVDCRVTIKVAGAQKERVFYLLDKDHTSTSSYVSNYSIAAKDTWYDSWSISLTNSTWYAIIGSGSNCYIASMQFVANPTYSETAGTELTQNSGTVTLTSSGTTIYYKWSTSSSAYAANAGATLADAADGSGTSPVDATAPDGTGTYYLYAVAKKGTLYSDVVKRNYTIVAATPSCTAPNHVDITPTTEDGNYGWRYTTGETLKLTATPYSSAGTGSPITSGITGYQWQKYVGSEWTNLVDGGSISGATTANLQISGLTTSNGGSYRCTISTGATCSTSSGGYWVRVFTLNGNYSGSSFTENAITWTGANSGTATVHLNAGQTYEFKIYDNDGKTFGNGGTIAADATGWGFGTGSGNCSLTTYYEGDYTFTITDFNHAADGSPYVTVAATYPERTIYMECGDWKNDGDKMAIYYWRGDKNGWSDFMSTFDCDNNVRYVDIPSWAQYIIFGRFASSKTSTGNWDDKHNQSCNLTLGANDKFIFSGWSDCDGNSSFTNTTSFSPSTYTISFAGGTGSSGSMSSISSIACGANQALTANSFTKAGYNFSHWTANVDVTVGGETVTAGSAIANSATIQNITSNITLTAQWTLKTTTITINANTANLGSTTPGTVTATYGSALPSFTAAAPANTNGYQLTGYYTGATNGDKIIDANGTLVASTDYADGSGNWKYTSATCTLYPHYEAKTFSITYLDDDESTQLVIDGAPTSYTYGVGVAELPTPSKSGYRFVAWYNQWCVAEDEDGDQNPGWGYVDKCITVGIADNDHGNATFIAKWAPEYSVSITTTNASKSTGASKAYAGENYVATFASVTGYDLPTSVTVTIGGSPATLTTDYTWSAGTLTVLGASVTGAIAITVTGAAQTYTISYKDQGNETYSGSNLASLPTSHTYGAATALVDGVKAGYTFGGWYTDESCTVSAGSSIGATAKTADFTLYAKWTEDECGITLTQFGTQYKTNSPRRLFAYTSNKFDERFIIENDDSNTHGVSYSKTDSLYLYLNNGKKFSVHASDVLKDSIFEDVTKIKFKYRAGKSGKSITLTFDVYVGGTKVGTVSKAITDQTWYTETIMVSPAKDGRVTFKNTGSSSDYALHFDAINICGTLPDPCTEITPTWSTDYTSTTLNVGATSSTPVVGKDGSSGTLSFSSSDDAIATVNSSGVVTAVKSGSVTITATVAEDEENNKCEGTVTKTFTIKAGITYNTNGADSGDAPTDATYYAANADITILGNTGLMVKDGKVFNGWNTKANGSGTHYEVGATMKMPNKSAGVTLYAEWVGYATSWEWWNSGESNGSTTFTYLTNKNYVLSFASSASTSVASWDITGTEVYRGVKIKTKDHNMSFWVETGKRVSITFGYMSTKPTFTVGGVNKAGDLSTSTTDSATVTYTTSADTKFYIENETSTGTAFTIKRVKIEDDGYTVTATATPNMTGTFTGSTTITNSPVTSIESGTIVSSLNNTFTIGETTVTAPATIAGTVTVDDGGTPYDASCTWRFDHWNNLPATVTADVDDVEAEYIPTFAINYDTRGGTINAGQVDWYEYTGSSSDEVTLPTNVTKTGYTFVKWMQDCSAWSGDDVERSVITCDNNGNFSLYAVWTEDTHSVSVAAGAHGSVSTSSVSGVGIATASGNITATPDAGYSFAGWTLPDGVTAASTYTSSSNPIQINATADGKTITANYTPINYTITYNLNSGTNPVSPAPKTGYNIEDEDYDLPVPTYSGHVFQGWYTDSEFTSDRVYVLASGSTGNKTYYAKWGAEVSVVWDIDAVDDKLYKGGGGHTVTAIVDNASWTGSASSLVLGASDGVILGEQTTGVYDEGTYDGKAYVTATFDITEDVEGDAITFYLTAPANGSYGAIEASHDEDLDACPSGGDEDEYYSYTISSTSAVTDASTTGGTFTSYNSGSTLGSASGYYTLKDNSIDKAYFIINTTNAIAVGDRISVTTNSTEFDLYTSAGVEVADNVTTYYTVEKGDGICGTHSFKIGRHDSGSQFKTFTVTSVTPDGVVTDLEWDTDPSSDAAWDTDHLAKEVGNADFTFTASADNNTLGAITYSSSNTSVATVNATTGKVHIVGTGDATITATLAESGCYNGNTATYDITVTSSCSDVAGTVTTENLGCEGIRLTVSGYTAGATIAWYKDGYAITPAATGTTYTATAAGTYYAVTTGSCALASNSITIENADEDIDPIIFADEFTVKVNRSAEYRLMQLEEGETIDKENIDNTLSWVRGSDFSVDGPDENGVVSIRVMLTSALKVGDGTITLPIKNTCGTTVNKTITIHAKAADAKPQIAWIATGTKGDISSVLADQSTNTALYEALEATGRFDLTPRNCYWTVSEADLIKEYSKYDLVILTDYPNSQTGPNGNGRSKSYTNALGLLIDRVPMLTFEAFVSGCPNWGFESNPTNTASTQNDLTLLCNANDIFGTSDVFNAGESVTVGDVADGQALQGFELDAMPNYVFIAMITDGGTNYVTCCERQENMNARMMVFGLNANVMDAITATGQQMVIGFVDYLLKDENASIPDCSVIFTGGASGTGTDWNTASNWEGSTKPNAYASVRLDKPCVVADDVIAKAGYIKIHVSTVGDTYTGSLTISPQATMIVQNQIYRVVDNDYTDYLPTEAGNLVVQANSSHTGALIFNNNNGCTNATVEMYSPSYWETIAGKKTSYWSYVGVPIQVANVGEYFYGAVTYLYDETSGWIRKKIGSQFHDFEGIGLAMQSGHKETFAGTLASTQTKKITLTKTAGVGEGENMIGNSWTAPIQIANFDASDFGDATATVMIYQTGRDDNEGNPTYVTATAENDGSVSAGQWLAIPINVPSLDGYDGLKVIPAMQAFQVNTSSRTTLTLDYDKLVRGVETDLNTPMRAPARTATSAQREVESVMRVRVSGNTTRSDVWLLQAEQFSDAFDNGWEASYVECDNRSPQFYAQSPLGKMAFIAKQDLEGTVLGFAPSRDGDTYLITFHYVGDEEFYLNDIKLQQSVLIDEENSYTFTFEEGDSNRFYIGRTPFEAPSVTTGTVNLETETPQAIKVIYNDKLYIIRGGRVYSAEGQLVK